ncbi:MAG: TraM recognition domain-containing protein [Micromonosporaceae bacterium]|nr:TraM recognition domain-containing protein [Micromonosporaceae bacterium]
MRGGPRRHRRPRRRRSDLQHPHHRSALRTGRRAAAGHRRCPVAAPPPRRAHPRPHPGGGRMNPQHPSDLVTAGLAVLAAVLTTVWAGAQLSALLTSAQPLPVGVADVAAAAARLPGAVGDPAAAWPPHVRVLLGPAVLYWTCTLLAAAAMATAAATLLRLGLPQVGVGPRTRLGVDTRARLASPAELAPLIVRRPTPGRLTLGTVHGRLVATEDRHHSPARGRRARRRQGDRTSVIVIGPTRCGKTANTVTGILEWDGPAILSSVKTDLLAATIDRRRELGEVRVFDPTAATGHPSAHWSPLRAAHTAVGAQKAARALVDAGPKTGAENLAFFQAMAQQLLWPVLYTAALGRATMHDVVNWLLVADRPTDTSPGEIAPLLDYHTVDPDPNVRADARLARAAIEAIWQLDERTRGGTYATAHTLLLPWQDPTVLNHAQQQDITLEWLLEGSNTLYLCGPTHEQRRLASVFGGLLGDLFQQAYEHASRTNRPLPSTLVVLDEAGNTPAAWLPHVASTCAGIGLLLVTIWQSKAQIDHAYRTLADSVVTNHGTKIIFAGVSDRSTLDYAAALIGDEELQQRSVTADAHPLNGHGPRSISHTATTAKLLPADLLRRIAPGQGLLIHGTLPPAHLHARPYYQVRRPAYPHASNMGMSRGRSG